MLRALLFLLCLRLIGLRSMPEVDAVFVRLGNKNHFRTLTDTIERRKRSRRDTTACQPLCPKAITCRNRGTAVTVREDARPQGLRRESLHTFPTTESWSRGPPNASALQVRQLS